MLTVQDNYRKDVDGLRAIAVILVILSHFKVPFFEGGYIGVDIFFVISGFVITKVILSQKLLGEFSLKQFYIKRIKRLAPALITVVFVSLIAFFFILSPNDLIKSFESAIWISAYLSNIFLWLNYGGYFSETANSAPFLHTWSLAIEEQFYLLWPLLLTLLYKLKNKNLLLYVTVILVVTSTIISEVSLNYTFGASYYLLPTRAFELGIGCILAIVNPRELKSTHFVNILSTCALIGLISVAMVYNEDTKFPGLNAFYVCFLTAIFISFYKEDSFPYKVMTGSFFQHIGKMSYSLYLWHWPVLTWMNYRLEVVNYKHTLAALLLIFLLSFLSWKYVENPVRKNRTFSNKVIIFLFVACPILLSTALHRLVILNDGYPERFDSTVQSLENSKLLRSNELRGSCHSALINHKALPSNSCIFGKSESKTSSFLFGDSHANHLVGFIEVVGLAKDFTTIDYTLDQCVPVFDLVWGSSLPRAQACRDRNNLARNYIQQAKPDIVFIAGSWPNYGTESIFENGAIVENIDVKYSVFKEQLIKTISFIADTGAKVVLFRDTAFSSSIKPDCPIKKAMFSNSADCSIPYFENQFMTDILQDVRTKFDESVLEIIDPKSFYCDSQRCALSIGKTLVYIDEDHITYEASKILGFSYLTDKEK